MLSAQHLGEDGELSLATKIFEFASPGYEDEALYNRDAEPAEPRKVRHQRTS